MVKVFHPSNYPQEGVERAVSSLEDFRNSCQQQFIAFFTANQGIRHNRDSFERRFEPRQGNNSRISFGTAFPDAEQLPGKSTIATMYQKDYLEALKAEREFENQQAKMFIVFIFHLWDDNFRHRIANSLSISNNLVECDLMGDIRLIRNSIIHRDSVVQPQDLNRLKMLPQIWNIEAGKLSISNNMVHAMMEQINAMCIRIKSD